MRTGLTGRLGRLEKRDQRAAVTPARCRCCAGIDFRTGRGEWDPPMCLVLTRDPIGDAPPVSFAWCKSCGRCIEAELGERPHGQEGPWRVSNARPGELPV